MEHVAGGIGYLDQRFVHKSGDGNVAGIVGCDRIGICVDIGVVIGCGSVGRVIDAHAHIRAHIYFV